MNNLPYCPECGKEIKECANFCENCGSNLAQHELIQDEKNQSINQKGSQQPSPPPKKPQQMNIPPPRRRDSSKDQSSLLWVGVLIVTIIVILAAVWAVLPIDIEGEDNNSPNPEDVYISSFDVSVIEHFHKDNEVEISYFLKNDNYAPAEVTVEYEFDGIRFETESYLINDWGMKFIVEHFPYRGGGVYSAEIVNVDFN